MLRKRSMFIFSSHSCTIKEGQNINSFAFTWCSDGLWATKRSLNYFQISYYDTDTAAAVVAQPGSIVRKAWNKYGNQYAYIVHEGYTHYHV